MTKLSDALIYHISDLTFHYLNAYLVYLLIKKFTKNKLVPILGLSIFLFHPSIFEIIPTLDRRHEVIAGLFGLLALYFADRSTQDTNLFYIASLFFYFLGSLSKEIIVVFLPSIIFFYLFKSGEKKFINTINLSTYIKSTGYILITVSIWVFTNFYFSGYRSYNKIFDHSLIELIERSNVFFSNFLYHTVPNFEELKYFKQFIFIILGLHILIALKHSKYQKFLFFSFIIFSQFLFINRATIMTPLLPNFGFTFSLVLNIYLLFLLFYFFHKLSKKESFYILLSFSVSLLSIFLIRLAFGFLGLRGGYISTIFFVFIISLILDYLIIDKLYKSLQGLLLIFWISFIIFSGIISNISVWTEATKFNFYFYQELTEIITNNQSLDSIILENQPYVGWDYEYGRPNTVVYSVQQFTVDAWIYHNFPDRKINVQQKNKYKVNIDEISSQINFEANCYKKECVVFLKSNDE
tara:strand:- start:437 stop:1834 length:1398 start_codon:yes stop_codon:yes gene_type:complete